MQIFARRHWIPPSGLLYAQAAHGFSWALILWAAWSGRLFTPPYQFAWIHTVALGWVTMAALCILMHALPSFIDAPWRAQGLARWCIAAYGAGVAMLIAGFLRTAGVLQLGGTIVAVALTVYMITAFATTAGAPRSERVARAVSRAFNMTFVFLLATAALGTVFAWALNGRATFAPSAPPTHAALGMMGWLSLLIFGVSQRTLRPITEQTTRMRWMHIVVGLCGALGATVCAAGEAFSQPALTWIGGGLFALGALGYCVDKMDVVARAQTAHRAPLAFVVAGLFWLLVALVLGAGTIAGRPWQAAYGFVFFMGWVGQFVNAHLYHIGIRLLATVYRGEHDETSPKDLLEARLTWFSFFAFQVAIAGVLVALLYGSQTLAARAAVFGLTGWIAMVANVMAARARASTTATRAA